LVVPTGSTIFAPPYDWDWSLFGLRGEQPEPFNGKVDGEWMIWNPPDPGATSAAGIGVSLNVTSPSLVSITPQGTYDFYIHCSSDIPGGWTKGGLGATVYQNADQTPILSELATLWSMPTTKMAPDIVGNGTLASAVVAGPSGIFGTQFYAPINLFLQPGSTYLVWIWNWELSNVPDNPIFFADLWMTLPFISLTSAPPPGGIH
jgi:hypothetical protein